ncbi:MAG: hypothetical protein K2N30_01290 [Clostridia bacterium]|nr:hypothetical protein [Clostridia bacterium]
MKKKFVAFCVAVIAIISVCLCLGACETPAGTTPSPTLKTGIKYCGTAYASNENYEEYYIFETDGTAEYRRYHIYGESNDYNEDYTVKFKYTYADETAVVCFYDSVGYGDKHTASHDVDSTTTHILSVSENVIIRTSYYGTSVFVNENYFKTLTNFGK